MRQDEARLAEAYETLYDECRLQTYLDHHPSEVDSNEEELDNAGQGNDEEQEEEQQQEADGAISATDAEDSEEEVAEGSSRISPSDNGNDDLDKSEESKDLFEEGWTRSEVSTFFTSLGRRSRLFPDLISRDLKHSKSTSQVAHLLALLKQKACSGEESSKGLTLKGTTQASSKTLGKRRRIEKMKAAHEVSDDWLAFEEKMAGRLRVWQQAEDMEDFTTATPARDSKDGCVTWDEQVLNVLLFLRHHPLISPDANAANTTCDVPLSVLSSQDAAEQRIFSFAAKIVPSLLGLKERSYLMFAKVHPVPSTRRKNSTNTEAVKEDLESLAAKVLFRGAELGIIAWVEVDGFGSGEELPQARLLKNSKSWPSSLPEGRLVWLDTVINHRDSKAASVMLDHVREAAAHRILNNLRWSEARTLAEYFGNAGSEEVNDETSTTTATNPIQSPSQLLQDVERLTRAGSEYKGWVDGYLAQANYSSLTYPERNRLRSRVHRRIQLFGIEKALAMPLEAQTAGRKRKAVGAVDEQVNGDPAQEVEEFDLHEEQAQQTVVPRPSTRPPTSWLEDTREGKATSMTPFKQAGVGPALVKRLLRSASQDVFLLLNMSKLKNIAQ